MYAHVILSHYDCFQCKQIVNKKTNEKRPINEKQFSFDNFEEKTFQEFWNLSRLNIKQSKIHFELWI